MPRASLKKVIRNLALIILLSSVASCAGPRPDHAYKLPERKSKPSINILKLEKAIHSLINNERQRNGLPPMAWDDALAKIARKHSKDMSKRNYFDHYSPEGRDFVYRYQRDGYHCSIHVGRTIHMGAENIALNNLYDSVTTINGKAFYDWNPQDKIAATTVQGWMNSPGHRKNILEPYWKNEGIGLFIGPDGKVYITQNFC